MSFAIEPELQDRLRAYAKRKGISNSQCVRELIDRFIIDDDTIIPVVLKIPVELKGDKEQLAVWLESRKNAILEKLS